MEILSQLLLSLTILSIVNVASSAQKKVAPEVTKLSGKQLIDYVNSNQKLWKAGPSKLDTYPEHVKRGLMGVRRSKQPASEKKVYSETRFLDVTIPDEFDSRVNWPNCQSISTIRDQSACGSCWAFGAVEAMSDRICIQSEGKLQVSLSSADPVSCCLSCGFGCKGGDPIEAWRYWVSSGIVTGGDYTSGTGCQPYPFQPCEHHNNKTHFKPCQHELYHTPKCEWKCQKKYTKSYHKDKFYGQSAYAVYETVEAIQKEIMTNGPVEVAFDVYDDFLHYTGGIYQYTAGNYGGGHAVRMIGWGVENQVLYWLIANSWNSDWGENGLFRILRGYDECGIESEAVAGLAKL